MPRAHLPLGFLPTSSTPLKSSPKSSFRCGVGKALPKVFMSSNQTKPVPLFNLGRLTATQAALNFLECVDHQPLSLLRRHVTGDWGDINGSDIEANKQSIMDGSRILSTYVFGSEKVYVITEGDRSITTILMASEY
jgi:hypothetical protein